MGRFIKIIFTPGAPVASIPLILLSISIIAVFQFPAHLLISGGRISLGILANEFIAIAGVPILLILLLRFDRKILIPFKRIKGSVIVLVVGLTLGADIVIDYLTAASEYFFPLPAEVKGALDNLMAAKSPIEWTWKLILLGAVPAVCEEIYFRGFCQNSISAHLGKGISIVASAVIFALLHANPWHFHLYVLLGMLIGWVFAVTGSLWSAVVCHFVNNTWTFVGHHVGFSLPLGEGFGWNDLLFLSFGIVFFALCYFFFVRLQKPPFCNQQSY